MIRIWVIRCVQDQMNDDLVLPYRLGPDRLVDAGLAGYAGAGAVVCRVERFERKLSYCFLDFDRIHSGIFALRM